VAKYVWFDRLHVLEVEIMSCFIAVVIPKQRQKKSITLEVVCDQRLWIWHDYCGLSGGNNDLNVLDRSPLVRNLLLRYANGLGFWVNSNWYEKYYLLVDGIYPKWACFVQSFKDREDQKESNFALAQKMCKKRRQKVFQGHSS
jgi:hypothetical protein